MHPPNNTRKILDCLGLPSRPSPIFPDTVCDAKTGSSYRGDTMRRLLEGHSAACGRNQVWGFGWPRAISIQPSAVGFGKTSPQKAEKLRIKNLSFRAILR